MASSKRQPDLRLTKSQDIVPVIMAGILGIYGLVVAVLISGGLEQSTPLYNGFIELGAGLSVGLSGLAAGYVAAQTGAAYSSLTIIQICYRNRWRCWSTRNGTTAPSLRRHDPHSHFRRSSGSLRTDRCSSDALESKRQVRVNWRDIYKSTEGITPEPAPNSL